MTEHMDPAVRAAVLRDQQRRMRVDPAIAHNVARIEAQERLEEAESARRAAEEEHARQQAAREELEAEKQRRLDAWMDAGNDPADFPSVWAKLREEIFLEQQQARRRLQQQSSVF